MISLYSCPGVCKIFSSLSASHPQREVGHISLSSLCRKEWRSESTVTVRGPAIRKDKNKNLTPDLWASCCSHCPKTYWTNREMQILLSFKQQKLLQSALFPVTVGFPLQRGKWGTSLVEMDRIIQSNYLIHIMSCVAYSEFCWNYAQSSLFPIILPGEKGTFS